MQTLKQALLRAPRASLGALPTPMTRLLRVEQSLGVAPLWLKRDDLTGLGAGGNKVRPLEFLVGQALADGCDTLVASGVVQSNLCSAAAAAASKAGLHCVLLHNGEDDGRLTGNRLLNHLLGVETVFLGNVGSAVREQAARDLTAQLVKKGRKPYLVELGGATGRGALGYVNAIFELMEQREQLGLDIRHLFAPAGNGGIAAGLIYGNELLGRPFRLHIISVEDDLADMTAGIANIIAQTEEVTGIPFPGKPEEAAELTDAYRGDGWSCNTPESVREIPAFAREEGIYLENIYTAKLMVGFKDMVAKRGLSHACCIHSGGFGSLFAQYE